jgi:hypothetical protein
MTGQKLNTKYPDDIIREFTLSILSLQERKKLIENEIKEKQAFLRVIKKKTPLKYSELYKALEDGEDTFWKVKEIESEARANSFYEIHIKKEYFINTEQLKIMEIHFMKLYSRGAHDIRINQFLE